MRFGTDGGALHIIRVLSWRVVKTRQDPTRVMRKVARNFKQLKYLFSANHDDGDRESMTRKPAMADLHLRIFFGHESQRQRIMGR